MSEGEITRIVKLDRVPPRLTIEADAAERAALAARFGLVAIDRFHAEVALAQDGSVIEVNGHLRAAFAQGCAISGEPFTNSIDEPLAIRFVPALAAAGEEGELELSADDPDEIEYGDNAIDLGEALAQSFGLALDPYATGPEAAAARAQAGILTEDEAQALSGPFAALAPLRTKRPS